MNSSDSELRTQNSILFVVGPTGSGKSQVAMELARRLNSEIIAADSQTLRKDLDIGTAKPTVADQAEVKHHLLDVIGPYERFSVAQYQRAAKDAIATVRAAGKLPIVVGGTGLYVDALFYDYDLSLQARRDDGLEEKTAEELQVMIAEAGYELPNNPQNPRHLVGVLRRGGKLPQDDRPIERAKIYGILHDDEALKQRLDERIERMFAAGFVDEVKRVIQKYGTPPKKLDAIGYELVARHLDGELTLDEVKELFKREHWQYARRQKSWFKRNEHIRWVELDKATSGILQDMRSH